MRDPEAIKRIMKIIEQVEEFRNNKETQNKVNEAFRGLPPIHEEEEEEK